MAKGKDEGKREVAKSGEARSPRGGFFALSPFQEMEQWLDTFRRSWPGRPEWPSETRIPPVDVVDRPEQIVVRAHAPGIDKDNLEVSVNGNSVTIRGTSRREEEKEEGDYYRREISTGSFYRTIPLPAQIDDAGAKATFKEGVLELVLPKVASSKRRTIKVE